MSTAVASKPSANLFVATAATPPSTSPLVITRPHSHSYIYIPSPQLHMHSLSTTMRLQKVAQYLPTQASATISYDSRSGSSDMSGAFGDGNIGGAFSWFYGAKASSYSDIASKLNKAVITADVTYQYAAPVIATPVGWFDQGVLNYALTTVPHSDAFSNGDQGWNTYFGNRGVLRQVLHAWTCMHMLAIVRIAAVGSSHYSCEA